VTLRHENGARECPTAALRCPRPPFETQVLPPFRTIHNAVVACPSSASPVRVQHSEVPGRGNIVLGFPTRALADSQLKFASSFANKFNTRALAVGTSIIRKSTYNGLSANVAQSMVYPAIAYSASPKSRLDILESSSCRDIHRRGLVDIKSLSHIVALY
jgi:hypothetical protein